MKHAICLTALAGLLALTPGAHAGELGDALEETGWDLLLGTWVDESTGGAAVTWEIVWTHPETVITWTSTEGDRINTSLVAHSKNQDTFFAVSADNQGGSALGEWRFSDDEATAEALYVTGNGEAGAIRLILTREQEDADTITVRVDGTTVVYRMIRAKDPAAG